jgi:hypothetical protein
MNGGAIYSPMDRHYSSVSYIDADVKFMLDRVFEENMVNAFCYTVDDDILQIYYGTLQNEGEIKYYRDRRSEHFDNYVRGTAPDDLQTCFYVIVDKKDTILELVSRINESSYGDRLGLIYYEFDIDGYYFLKINSHKSNKFTRLEELKEQTGADRLVVFGSGSSDIEMMRMADVSICLKNAPDKIKSAATLVLDTDNPDAILKTIEKIYHKRNFEAYLKKVGVKN